MAVVSRNRIANDLTIESQSEWIVARITAVGGSVSGSGGCIGYPHAWVEQSICANGYGYEDDSVNGLSGTTSALQAYAIDGSAAAVDDIVLLRPRVMDVAGNQVYEFIKSGGGVPNNLDCPHVTSVQCTGGMLVVTYDTTCVGA